MTTSSPAWLDPAAISRGWMRHHVATSVRIEQLHAIGGKSADGRIDQCPGDRLGIATAKRRERTRSAWRYLPMPITTAAPARVPSPHDIRDPPHRAGHRFASRPGPSWMLPSWISARHVPLMRISYAGLQCGSRGTGTPGGLGRRLHQRPHRDPDVAGITGRTT